MLSAFNRLALSLTALDELLTYVFRL